MNTQLIFDFQKSHKETFKNFVCCNENKLAYKAAMSFCRDKDFGYNKIYFYGARGNGKSHILKAIGNFFKEELSKSDIVYISTAKLNKKLNSTKSYDEIVGISKNYKDLDLLLLDDIDLAEDNIKLQDQVFHIYNELIDKGKCVVFAGRKPPNKINLQSHLQSRFMSGLVIKVGDIMDESKGVILKRLALDDGVNLSDRVVNYMLTHFSRNMSDFKDVFEKINRSSLSLKCKITIPFIKDIIKDYER